MANHNRDGFSGRHKKTDDLPAIFLMQPDVHHISCMRKILFLVGGIMLDSGGAGGQNCATDSNNHRDTMTTPKNDDSDLSELVNRARDAVELDDARRATRMEPANPLKRMMPVLIGVVFVVSVVLAVDSVWHHVAPQSEQKAVDDLVKMIDQASASVEEARTRLGRLPERLPNAALASVVRYGASKDGKNYVLIVEHGDVQVVRNVEGKNKILKRSDK